MESLIAEWSASSSMSEDLKQKAVELFRQAVAAPEIRRALTRPPGNVNLWREKRFEVVIGNRWVSGAFDRVVVSRDQNGKALEATVLDFKSDEVADERISGGTGQAVPAPDGGLSQCPVEHARTAAGQGGARSWCSCSRGRSSSFARVACLAL